eukprot:1159880-Pelagomonas_calceolata.AAC.12
MAAAERLLQHHRLSTCAPPTATQARLQHPAAAAAQSLATHTGGPTPTAQPAPSEASGPAGGPPPAGRQQPSAPAVAPPVKAEPPTQPHTQHGTNTPSGPATAGATPAAAAAAGTKIKFKLKGKLGSNGAPAASAAPAAPPLAVVPAAASTAAGAHVHASPKFALHNEDPPYEASLNAEERVSGSSSQVQIKLGKVLCTCKPLKQLSGGCGIRKIAPGCLMP